MYSISENSRKLFGKVAYWGIPRNSIQRLFQAQGFQLSVGTDPALGREALVEQYHEGVDWSDQGQVRRVLLVYRAALDEYGRPFGRFNTTQASNLLKSLERDGNVVIDGEIFIFPPEFEVDGPLAGQTGWTQIDLELARLKLDFGSADEAHAFQAVGLRCLTILRLLSDTLFDESRHSNGEPIPGPADVKARIDQFVLSVAGGKRFEHLRKLVRDAYAQANATKHRPTADRIDAGVVAAATILLAEMLRLIADLDQ